MLIARDRHGDKARAARRALQDIRIRERLFANRRIRVQRIQRHAVGVRVYPGNRSVPAVSGLTGAVDHARPAILHRLHDQTFAEAHHAQQIGCGGSRRVHGHGVILDVHRFRRLRILRRVGNVLRFDVRIAVAVDHAHPRLIRRDCHAGICFVHPRNVVRRIGVIGLSVDHRSALPHIHGLRIFVYVFRRQILIVAIADIAGGILNLRPIARNCQTLHAFAVAHHAENRRRFRSGRIGGQRICRDINRIALNGRCALYVDRFHIAVVRTVLQAIPYAVGRARQRAIAGILRKIHHHIGTRARLAIHGHVIRVDVHILIEGVGVFLR